MNVLRRMNAINVEAMVDALVDTLVDALVDALGMGIEEAGRKKKNQQKNYANRPNEIKYSVGDGGRTKCWIKYPGMCTHSGTQILRYANIQACKYTGTLK